MECSKLFKFSFFLILFLFLIQTANGDVGTSGYIWFTNQITSLSLRFSTPTTCLNYPATADLNVTVVRQPEGVLDANSTVSATVTKPNGDTNSINFSNANDGNYTFTYTFDSNGTFKFDVNASRDTATGDVNAYVYVGDFNINISFLQNGASYTQGASASIRNSVSNDDGNAFIGISGTTTIKYPNATDFVTDASMTETAGTGEYYYNFIAPSTAGTYSVTSTFSCGLASDSNSSGSFTVTAQPSQETPSPTPQGGGGGGGGPPTPKAVCGNRACELTEDASSCPIDCRTVFGPDANISNWFFDDGLDLAKPIHINVEIENTGDQTTDYILLVRVMQGRDEEFFLEQEVLDVKEGEKRTIVMNETWTPVLGGSHLIIIAVYSFDRQTKFDEVIELFDLEGAFRYDVEVKCKESLVKIGSDINATINLLNLGDYFEDVEVSWWVQGEQGQVFGKSFSPMALYPRELIQLEKSVMLMPSIAPGMYSFKAEVKYKDFEKQAGCSFSVELEPDFYKKLIELFEKELQYLQMRANEKKAQGFITSGLEGGILATQNELAIIKTRVFAGDFRGADTDLDDISDKIEKLKIELLNLKKAVFAIENIAFIIIIALLIIAIFYIASKKKNKLKRKIDKILGLDGYWGFEEEKGQSDTLNKLLGLK